MSSVLGLNVIPKTAIVLFSIESTSFRNFFYHINFSGFINFELQSQLN